MLCKPGNACIPFGLRQILDTRAQHANGDRGHIGARVDDNDAPRTAKRNHRSSRGRGGSDGGSRGVAASSSPQDFDRCWVSSASRTTTITLEAS